MLTHKQNTSVSTTPASESLATADFFQKRGENKFKEAADKVWAKVDKRKPLPQGDWMPV